jgi:hypothetical protein
MVGNAQKSHGARYGLYGGCSNGVLPIYFFQTEHRIQFRYRPMRFLDVSNHEKGAPRQEISACSTFSRSGWSVVRSASLVKGGTSKKGPSPHLHKVPTWCNKVSPRTLQTALVFTYINGKNFISLPLHVHCISPFVMSDNLASELSHDGDGGGGGGGGGGDDTGWTIGFLGFESQRELGIFLFTSASRTALGPTQPPIQWVPGAPFLGVKRPMRETVHSPPSSAEVKNAWSYTSTPLIRLHGVVLS